MANIGEIMERVLEQEITLSEASRITGFSKDFIRNSILRKYQGNPAMVLKIYSVFKYNKVNSTTIYVDYEKLEEQFWKLMNQETTLEKAGRELGINDRETVKSKLIEFVQMSHNPEIMKLFEGYIARNNADYTNINFRLVAIDMMKGDFSQSEMADMMGLSSRTLSREFAKFEQDEDLTLYLLLKEYGEAKMKRVKFTQAKKDQIIDIIDEYSSRHPELLEEILTSRTEEKIKREREILEHTDMLMQKGYNQRDIALMLGVSPSFIRRARKHEEYRKLVEIQTTEERE